MLGLVKEGLLGSPRLVLLLPEVLVAEPATGYGAVRRKLAAVGLAIGEHAVLGPAIEKRVLVLGLSQ
jgi:hypothetical protein